MARVMDNHIPNWLVNTASVSNGLEKFLGAVLLYLIYGFKLPDE